MHSIGTARRVPIQASQMTDMSPVLDRVNQTIRKGRNCTQLSPKAYAVLDYLQARSKTLVSKDELLDAVWPNVCVGDAVLKNAVCELRRALGDDPSSPQFIGTVHRRGYRFVGVLPLAETATSAVDLTPDEPKLGPEFPRCTQARVAATQ